MNERLRILQRQPRRISITLSFHVHEELLKRSEEEGRSMSNLCAFLLEDALRQYARASGQGNNVQDVDRVLAEQKLLDKISMGQKTAMSNKNNGGLPKFPQAQM